MNLHLDDGDLWDGGAVSHPSLRSAGGSVPEALVPLRLRPVGGSNSYLVCEGEGEDQHLSIQFPYCLILHVGHLDFDGHWTLQVRSGHYAWEVLGQTGTTLSSPGPLRQCHLSNRTPGLWPDLLLTPPVTWNNSLPFSRTDLASLE